MLSERGRQKLCANGFILSTEWLVIVGLDFGGAKKKGDGCKGRIHESNSIITKVQRQYTHPPNPGRIETMACVTSMKCRAADTCGVLWVTLTGLCNL